MNKLLIISGPTASGKTSLAVELAKKYHGVLVSADSRQLYKGMDIGTGKDHPVGIPLHLIDILDPDEDFSVAQYRRLAVSAIDSIQKQGKLPILVGGTGLYIDSVINPQPTFTLKPVPLLRFFLNRLSVPALQKIYKLIDHRNFSGLNNSDLHNPHRLIRRIEIALFSRRRPDAKAQPQYDALHISLTAPNQFLYDRIDQRVTARLNVGLLDEIARLLKHYRWSDKGLNTLAYKEFKPYFEHPSAESKIKAVNEWKFDEHSYMRRQKTWFNKKAGNIFDISLKDTENKIYQLVDVWYNKL
ncbi:MAG TPA: tRNA (adenosine(37)-N6)-dimethylallyltransferase MiaA [Patescibacteria group bacterium]